MWRTAGKAPILVFFLPGERTAVARPEHTGLQGSRPVAGTSSGHYPNSESGHKSQSEDAASLEKVLGLMWLGSP